MGRRFLELDCLMSETKTLFVRISPESHALLCQIAAHDALESGSKVNFRKTAEAIISEAAASRQLSPSQKSSGRATGATASQQTRASANGTRPQER